LEAIEMIEARHPFVPIIVVTGSERPADFRRAKESGASGFLHKSLDMKASRLLIMQVLAGERVFPEPEALKVGRAETDLTQRQREILTLLVTGKTNKEIARETDISAATVRIHLHAIFKALGVGTRTEAAMVAVRDGLVDIC